MTFKQLLTYDWGVVGYLDHYRYCLLKYLWEHRIESGVIYESE